MQPSCSRGGPGSRGQWQEVKRKEKPRKRETTCSTRHIDEKIEDLIRVEPRREYWWETDVKKERHGGRFRETKHGKPLGSRRRR